MPRLVRLSDADPASLGAELTRVRSDGDAAVVLPPGIRAELLPSPLPAALAGRLTPPQETALVVQTSGSTGEPRVVALPGRAVDAAIDATHRRLGAVPGERWALALPVRHVAGIMVVLRARALGTDVVVVTEPGAPTALAAIAAEHVAIVPTQLLRALDAGVDLARFRTVLVGGGPAPAGLIERARSGGARIVTSYGMTETCGGCIYDGRPLDGTEVTIAPDGRIGLRGPSVHARLLDGAPLCDADGWFITSDRGRMTDGRLEVLGRADDMIITGGVNVDPVAVAESLRTHPSVADVEVFGWSDDEWGQRVVAIVVGDAVDPTALRAHVAGRLGATHAPRDIVWVDAIARDGMGKLTAAERKRFESMGGTRRNENSA